MNVLTFPNETVTATAFAMVTIMTNLWEIMDSNYSNKNIHYHITEVVYIHYAGCYMATLKAANPIAICDYI